jgi:hypothetical protein
MITPAASLGERRPCQRHPRECNRQGLSSAYVVDQKMKLLGVLSIDAALKARQGARALPGGLTANAPPPPGTRW